MGAHDIRKGQKYRTLEPINVDFLTHWRAPYTGGGSGTLAAGEVFVIKMDPPAGATAASCDAERKEVEKLLVPEADRNEPKYNGFSLVIGFEIIRTRCERSDAV
jgi:hypothetical protein